MNTVGKQKTLLMPLKPIPMPLKPLKPSLCPGKPKPKPKPSLRKPKFCLLSWSLNPVKKIGGTAFWGLNSVPRDANSLK